MALARAKRVDAALTIDAIVIAIATAALSDAILVTGDTEDFKRLSAQFPGVAICRCDWPTCLTPGAILTS